MNQKLFEIFYSLAHKNAFLDWLWAFSAEYLPIILTLFFIYLLVVEKDSHRRLYFLALVALSVIISSGIVTPFLRYLIESPRPFVSLDIVPLVDRSGTPSMPSGHVMTFFPIALAGYYLSHKWRWYFIIGILFMGVARVVSGVHWPTDILVGLVLATASFYLAKYLLKKGGVKAE